MAAGRGVRMRPLTDDCPKPLLKLGRQTILDYALSQLPADIDEVIIVVGYLKQLIIEHVNQFYSGMPIRFVEDDQMRGTGYAVKICQPYLTGKFLVINGDDLYSKTDLEKLLDYDLAFLVQDRVDTARFGRILQDSQGDFSGIELGGTNKPGQVIIGAYVLNQKFFGYPMAKTGKGEFGLPQTLLAMAKAGEKIKPVPAEFWRPIGFPEDLSKAQNISA